MAFVATQSNRKNARLRLLVIVVLIFGGIAAIYSTSYRWAFYLGGNFHLMPYWQGVGKAHAHSGDYVFYVRIGPESGTRAYLSTNLGGMGQVCTSKGQDIVTRLGGGMRKNLGTSTDGEAISLYLQDLHASLTHAGLHFFELDFKGHWRNPNLVVDDQGTLAKIFMPDGTIDPHRGAKRNYTPEVVGVTFAAGSISDYKAACAALKH